MSGASISSWRGGRLPRASVLTDTEPTDTDHFTVITVLGENPEPDTVTMVPGGPMFGVTTRWGAAGGLGGCGRCCVAAVAGGGGVAGFVGGGRVVGVGGGGVVAVGGGGVVAVGGGGVVAVGGGGVVAVGGGGGALGADIGTDSEVLAEKLACR